MAVEEPLIPTQLTPLRVEEGSQGFHQVLETYDRVAAALYKEVRLAENDALALYTGYRDGSPVVAASLFSTGRLCGLYDLFTHPEQRRKGYGTAMLAALLEMREADWYMTSAASEEERRLYEKFGFHPYCHFEVYTYGA